MRFKAILASFMFLLPALNVEADQQAVSSKATYHLLHPTPVELMRQMSTDRPDKTESPYTVDTGHVQVEMSLADYSYDHHNPGEPQTRTDTLSVTPTNFKIGILNNADLQFVLNPYVHEKTRDDGASTTKRGFGDIQTRLKVNLWGNDEGNTALGVMPFVKIPSNTDNLGNDDTEGGVIIPLAVALPGEWNMGLMVEFDFNKNTADDNYHTEYIQSITFSHAIIGNLNGYVEFFNNSSGEDKVKRVSTIDAGLTYAVSKDIQLDMGVNIGVTESADDVNPFCGVSMRY